METKLNLGVGLDYKEGYINIDFNKHVKADLYFDLTNKFPFEDNSVDEIFTEGFVEHIPKDKIWGFFDECYRVCKNKAIIKILTNHYTSVWAFQHLDHKCYFGMDTFGNFDRNIFSGEKYTDSIFKVNKIKLFFFYPKLAKYGFLNKIPIDWMFNLNITWQRFMERFQKFGFDGIYYELEVVKYDNYPNVIIKDLEF